MSRRGKGGTPISLFSFQDIITSVTGIMILVTLFLGLEVIRRKEGSPEVQTAQLTEELRQAADQARQAREQIVANNEELNRLRKRLEEEGDELVEELKHDESQIRRQLRDLDALNQTLEKEKDQSETKKKAAEKSRTELGAVEKNRAKDHQTLEQIIREAAQKRDELNKLKQSKRVLFNAGVGESKTPWLVELGASQILAARVGKKESPQVFKSVADLVRWAQKLDRGREYFVLLAKPDNVDAFLTAKETLQLAGFDLGYDLLGKAQTAIDPVTGAATP